MCKKNPKIQLNKDDRTIVNHSVLKRYNRGEYVTILRGKFKKKKFLIEKVYYNGGEDWAKLDCIDEKSGKLVTIEAIDVYEFEKLKKG